MKYTVSALVLAIGLAATAAHADGGVKVGDLTCKMDGVKNDIVYTKEEFACVFTPTSGDTQTYTAVLKEVGVNLSITKDNTMVWGVLAPTDKLDSPDVLKGTYVGGSGAVEVGGGVSANVLVGGGNSITLQPISVSGMVGVGASVGISSLEIK